MFANIDSWLRSPRLVFTLKSYDSFHDTVISSTELFTSTVFYGITPMGVVHTCGTCAVSLAVGPGQEQLREMQLPPAITTLDAPTNQTKEQEAYVMSQLAQSKLLMFDTRRPKDYVVWDLQSCVVRPRN